MPEIASGFSQNGLLCLLPFMREEFVLTRTQVGYYSTSVFLSAAAISVFSGSVVDTLGPRKSIILGIVYIDLIMIFYGQSSSYIIVLFLALLFGFGVSIITPSVIKGTIMATSSGERAFSIGFTQSGFGFGSIIGASLLPLLGENFGWRVAVRISTIIILIICFLIYKFYKEPHNISLVIDTPKELLPFKDNFLFLFTNKPLFRFCLLSIIFGISLGAVTTHFTVFLSEDLSLSRTMAGICFGMLQLGGFISRPGWGFISDRIFRGNRRFSLFIIGLSIGIFYLFFGLFLNNSGVNIMIVLLLSFFLGCSALGWSGVNFVTIGEFAQTQQVGIATGLSLLFIRLGILITPPIFGLIADVRGNYEYSWLIFGVIIVFLSLLFLLKD